MKQYEIHSAFTWSGILRTLEGTRLLGRKIKPLATIAADSLDEALAVGRMIFGHHIVANAA